MCPPAPPRSSIIERLRAREQELRVGRDDLAVVRDALRALRVDDADAEHESAFVTALRVSLQDYRDRLVRATAELRAIQREIGMLEQRAAQVATGLLPPPPSVANGTSAPAIAPPPIRRTPPRIDAKLAARLLSAVQTTPGLTYTEISRLTGIDPAEASPALRRLASKAQIEQDGARWYPR